MELLKERILKDGIVIMPRGANHSKRDYIPR